MKKRILSSTVLAAPLLCFSSGVDAQKIEKLFNGEDLSNWNFVVDKNSIPAGQVYFVHDDKIFIASQPFGYMYTKKKCSDYKLHVEWRQLNEDSSTNSGIFLYIADLKSPFPDGIECSLQAGRTGLFMLLGGSDPAKHQQRPGEGHPFSPVVKNVNPSNGKPTGKQNETNIFVKDGVITVYINDVYQNTGTNKVKEDHVGLQSEGKEVEFRNVTLTKW